MQIVDKEKKTHIRPKTIFMVRGEAIKTNSEQSWVYVVDRCDETLEAVDAYNGDRDDRRIKCPGILIRIPKGDLRKIRLDDGIKTFLVQPSLSHNWDSVDLVYWLRGVK